MGEFAYLDNIHGDIKYIVDGYEKFNQFWN